MKQVTAFVGTGRKGHTYEAVRGFLGRLEAYGDVETRIVALTDYQLEDCRGCKACFVRGEEFCPLHDDRDALLELIAASDGVVLASPNYSFQVSAIMKRFLDRLGFAFHRPRYHGKTFTSIVVQGFYGGGKIVRYLDFVGGALGFNVIKGTSSTALDPMTDKEHAKRAAALEEHARRFHTRLNGRDFPVPGLVALAVFRMGRTNVRLELDDTNRDFRYYRDKGWFDSDFYYETQLGVVKRLLGRVFDSLGARMVRARAG